MNMKIEMNGFFMESILQDCNMIIIISGRESDEFNEINWPLPFDVNHFLLI